MKTMMELLIRLQQLRRCCERTARNKQLTDREKNATHCFKNLVRDSLPPAVVMQYDRLRQTESELIKCPEVFAMAVLVATWRSLSPAGRRRLEAHFAAPQRGRRQGSRRSGCCGGPKGGSSRGGTTSRVRARAKALPS